MTVAELIDLLNEFPQELPVFFSPDGGRRAVAPMDAVMDLVNATRGWVLEDDDPFGTIPPGYAEALVIHPRAIREPVESQRE